MKRIFDAWFLQRVTAHLFIQVVFLVLYEDFTDENMNPVVKYGLAVVVFFLTDWIQRRVHKRQLADQANARNENPTAFEHNRTSPLVNGFFLLVLLILLLAFVPLIIG